VTGPKRSGAAKLLNLFGGAVLMAVLAALAKGGSVETKGEPPASPQSPQSPWPEIITYVVGYGLSLLLTLAAFVMVHRHWASPSTAFWIVFALALAQIIVHFRCFLHVTLRGPARDDLYLILFSTLIILLMVGGTLVIMFNLRMRMM
jgi:cytochrome o ubiquinol oxidase operon protein cyoD